MEVPGHDRSCEETARSGQRGGQPVFCVEPKAVMFTKFFNVSMVAGIQSSFVQMVVLTSHLPVKPEI